MEEKKLSLHIVHSLGNLLFHNLFTKNLLHDVRIKFGDLRRANILITSADILIHEATSFSFGIFSSTPKS